jgi:hypothetical protein
MIVGEKKKKVEWQAKWEKSISGIQHTTCTAAQNNTYLDQESQVDVLRLGSLSVAVLDVVSLDIDTLIRKNKKDRNHR